MTAKETRDKKIKLGLYLGTPEEIRDPKDQKDFAAELSITPECLSRWKKDPLVKEIAENAAKYQAEKHVAQIVKKQIEKAENEGNTQAARLILDFTGQLKPKTESAKPLGKIEVEFITRDNKNENKS